MRVDVLELGAVDNASALAVPSAAVHLVAPPLGALSRIDHAVGLLRLRLEPLESTKRHVAVVDALLSALDAGTPWPRVIVLERRSRDAAYNRLGTVLSHANYTLALGVFTRPGFHDSPGTLDDVPHLDYVEVGTSNFDTLTGRASGGAQRGLAVEALPFYLAQLPERSGLLDKTSAAVVGSRSAGSRYPSTSFFFVHPNDIAAHRLPHWIKGCNQLGSPHAEALKLLRRRGLGRLMTNWTVPTRTLPSLLRERRVASIGTLKLDIEGQEVGVLRDVLEGCDSACEPARRGPKCPLTVMFEVTHTTPAQRRDLHAQFTSRGYVAVRGLQPPARDRVYVLAGCKT